MSANCTVFFLWSACTTDGLTLGSLPEWLTVLVTALALYAAWYAGKQAKKAAISAKAQAEAAAKALEHSAAAAVSAQLQATAANRAFEEDAKVREEAQARLVYSEIGVTNYVADNQTLTGEDKHWRRTVWDGAMLSPWSATDRTGQPNRNRHTTKDAVKIAVVVHNLSNEIISQVRVFFRHPVTHEHSAVDKFTDIIPPNKKRTYFVVIPVPDGTNIYASQPESHFASWVQVIDFQDSAGVWWSRTGSEPIEKLDPSTTRPRSGQSLR